MSTYEKIISIIIGVLLVAIVIFSYHELRESPEGPGRGPNFDESLGQNFVIGPFTTTVAEQSSGGLEQNCGPLQSVIIGALHDIMERLETHSILSIFTGDTDAFEVDGETLQLFCNKNAEVTLADAAGHWLVLQKVPFTRGVPQGGTQNDIGTEVRINASIIPAGSSTPAQPTTYGDILIPDRFLDSDGASFSN